MRRTRIKPGDTTVAIAYLRVSTDEQKLGLDVQRQGIEQWAMRDGVSIARWCIDELSGKLPLEDRPMLGEALAALRVYRAGMLVALRRDRLHRDVPTASAIERVVRESGAVVRTLDGAPTGEDAYSELQRTVLDAFAQFERALIALRIKGALQLKKERGEAYSHPPFGYRNDHGKLVPDERERELARTLWALQHDVHPMRGKPQTIRWVTARAREQGLTSRTGAPLSVHSVHRILQAAPALAQAI